MIVKDNTKQFEAMLKAVKAKNVLIGIPADNTERPDENINNAQLGYIHEYGAPEQNIPARPFLTTGVEKVKDKCAVILKHGLTQVFSGQEGFDESMRDAGQLASDSVKTTITDGLSPALSPATLRSRALKQLKSADKQQREIAKKAIDSGDYSEISATPLVDTGALLASITYVIRKK
jgi:hypothetical protein